MENHIVDFRRLVDIVLTPGYFKGKAFELREKRSVQDLPLVTEILLYNISVGKNVFKESYHIEVHTVYRRNVIPKERIKTKFGMFDPCIDYVVSQTLVVGEAGSKQKIIVYSADFDITKIRNGASNLEEKADDRAKRVVLRALVDYMPRQKSQDMLSQKRYAIPVVTQNIA